MKKRKSLSVIVATLLLSCVAFASASVNYTLNVSGDSELIWYDSDPKGEGDTVCIADSSTDVGGSGIFWFDFSSIEMGDIESMELNLFRWSNVTEYLGGDSYYTFAFYNDSFDETTVNFNDPNFSWTDGSGMPAENWAYLLPPLDAGIVSDQFPDYSSEYPTKVTLDMNESLFDLIQNDADKIFTLLIQIEPVGNMDDYYCVKSKQTANASEQPSFTLSLKEPCISNWSCTGYGGCSGGVVPCDAVEDLNICGEAYAGNYSEFAPLSECVATTGDTFVTGSSGNGNLGGQSFVFVSSSTFIFSNGIAYTLWDLSATTAITDFIFMPDALIGTNRTGYNFTVSYCDDTFNEMNITYNNQNTEVTNCSVIYLVPANTLPQNPNEPHQYMQIPLDNLSAKVDADSDREFTLKMTITPPNANPNVVIQHNSIEEGHPSLLMFSDACTPDWSCTGFTPCATSDEQDCNAVVDQNTCGLPYAGDYSEFGVFACNYCSRDIVVLNESVCVPATDEKTVCYLDNNFATCCNMTGIGSDCIGDVPQSEDTVCVQESCSFFTYSENDITGAVINFVSKGFITLSILAGLITIGMLGLWGYNRLKMM